MEERNAELIKLNDLPYINAHKSSLGLLFQNLIENSIKYNESDKPVTKIYTKEENKSISIFIEDNGIGIPEEYHSKVFGMFSRLHNQGEYEGSGLGLSICKKIIDKLNGDIIIHNKEGGGSVFEILLPKSIVVSELPSESLELSY